MFYRLLMIVAVSYALTASVSAEWTQLGHGGGGQIQMIKSDPSNPNRVYIGSDVAGLWRTIDNGQTGDPHAFTANPRYEYLTKDWSIRFCQDIAFDTETDPVGLFIATQTGVYYSKDDGAHWERVGSNNIAEVPTAPSGVGGQKVSSIALVRSGSNVRLYAGIGMRLAKDGVPAAPEDRIWVYDSIDDVNGEFVTTNAWSDSAVLNSTTNWKATVWKILANPNDADELWVCTEDGPYYSNNGGASWTGYTDGLENNNLHCRDIVANPANFMDARLVVKGIHRPTIGRDEFLLPQPGENDKLAGGYYKLVKVSENPNIYSWFRVTKVLQYYDIDGNLSNEGDDAVIEWNSIAIDTKATDIGPNNWGNYVFLGSGTAVTQGGQQIIKTAIQHSYNGNNIHFNGQWTEATKSVNDVGWQDSKPLISNPNTLHYVYDANAEDGRIWVGKSGSFFRSQGDFFGHDGNGISIFDPSGYTWNQEYTTQNSSYDEWANRGFVNTTVRGVATQPNSPNHIFTAQGDRGISESVFVGGVHYFEDLKTIMKLKNDKLAGDGMFVKFPFQNDVVFASSNASVAGASGISVLYKSINAGGTWTRAAGGNTDPESDPNYLAYNNGLPSYYLEYWDITAVPDDANSPLWLATVKKDGDRSESGVYQSADSGGDSWSLAIKGTVSLQWESVTNIQAVPSNANPNAEQYRLIIGTANYNPSPTKTAGIWVAVMPNNPSDPAYSSSNGWTTTDDGWKVKKVLNNIGACSQIAVYGDAVADKVTVVVATQIGLYVSTNAGNTFSKVINPAGQVGFGGVAIDVANKKAYAIRDGDYDTLGPGNAASTSPQLYGCDFTVKDLYLEQAGRWFPLASTDQPNNKRAWMLHVDQSSGKLFVATRGMGVLMHDSLSIPTLAPVTGDLNDDGFVGIADLNIVLGNWNQNVTAGVWAEGDPSGDGFVGIADLNEVLGNWNGGTPPLF